MARPTKRRRGFAIPRVSKVNGRGGQEFRSPDNQWQDAVYVAERNGIDIVGGGADIDVSGTTMQRRYLREGIEAIRNGDADCLVFPKLDRYARTTLGGLTVLDEVEALGGSLFFGDLDVDTSKPIGRQLFTIMLSQAEREVAEKAIDFARNARQATLDGVPIAPLLPGYVKVRTKKGERRVGVDKDVAKLIPPLFEMRARRASWGACRTYWHDKTGQWKDRKQLQRMIGSRLYRGELRYGDTVSPVRHKPLVTERLWKDAQAAPAPRPPRSRKPTTYLGGIVVCAGCDHPMTVTNTRGVPQYRCQSRAGGTWTCKSPSSIYAGPVDDIVVEAFLAWCDRKVGSAVTTGDLADDFAELDARIEEAEEELAAYLDKTPARSARFQSGAEKREAAVAKLVAERKRLESEQVVAGVRYRVREEWPSLNRDERRTMLRAGIERIRVHPASRANVVGGWLPIADRLGDIEFVAD